MKQFIYLDTDIVTSIIAQEEKGYVTQQTDEEGVETQKANGRAVSITPEVSANGGFWKFLQAEAKVSIAGEFQRNNTTESSTKKIVDRILHDAAFDIAYNYIKPVNAGLDEHSVGDPGDYLEIKRVFDYIDFDYLEGLFKEEGIIDYIKKTSAEQIEEKANQLTADFNREQIRKSGNIIKQELRKAIAMNNKQYEDTKSIIKAFRCLIPYSRMLLSSDGYLIPLDDQYFRIDPSNLGFKYGGKMTCVGLITNVIGNNVNAADPNNIFATIQNLANEALAKVLPMAERDLRIIHPIAIFYGQ